MTTMTKSSKTATKVRRMAKAAREAAAAQQGNLDDHEYISYVQRLGDRFLGRCSGKPLFTTDANPDALWRAYLGAFESRAERQHHDCHECRHFIQKFGGLVTIDEDGTARPAFWDEDDAPEVLKPAIRAMIDVIDRSHVTGVFLSSDKTWGKGLDGAWRHFALQPDPRMIYRGLTLSASQAMAEKAEDFKNVMAALGEWSVDHLRLAVRLLEGDALYRSEKLLGAAKWLLELAGMHVERDRSGRSYHRVMRAVALAPAGFCHPRGSMLGTLMDDIVAGLPYEDVARKFAAKMHPLQYQRPQAAPKAGTIAQAEKIIEQLKASGSLERRYLRVDEVVALWRPRVGIRRAKAGGVFGHLLPKDRKVGKARTDMDVPAKRITWEKFRREVLPTAEYIELYTGSAPKHYGPMVTAVRPDAPPIIQWDSPERRNPVSWYVWNGGSRPEDFGLKSGEYHPVVAISLNPHAWYGSSMSHQAEDIMLVIDGARETRTDSGAALFPEILRSELHGVRSVIEAYSRKASIAGLDEPHAAGLILDKGGSWDAVVRVTSGRVALEYTLDRWD